MSHFTVLVIGDDVEKQLAPFHEFECTGEDDEYVQDIDITDEVLAKAEKHNNKKKPLVDFIAGWYGCKPVPFGQRPDLSGEHKYGYTLVDVEGQVTKVVNRTNPNRKWDWWVMGGRWSGMLKLKDGATGERGQPGVMGTQRNAGSGYCDSALKGDIDLEGMRNAAGEEAAANWDKAFQAHKGEAWEPWSVLGPKTNYDQVARDTYHNQPQVEALRKVFDNPFHEIDQYLMPREAFIQQARNGALSTFAVLKDGNWVERGEMGWFGCASNEKDKDDWYAEFNKMLDELPDDTCLTVVDCHI